MNSEPVDQVRARVLLLEPHGAAAMWAAFEGLWLTLTATLAGPAKGCASCLAPRSPAGCRAVSDRGGSPDRWRLTGLDLGEDLTVFHDIAARCLM